jgi:MFS family permease
VACALAPNAAELIAARTVQGLGGAIVLPISLTILTTAFPAERRGMIVGIYGGLAGLAVAMGPIVGGAVTQGIDWHWISWINVPIGVAAVLLGLRFLPESYGAPERLDLVGVGLVTAGVVALVWAFSRASAVAPQEMGKASGINYMAQRFGAVFAVAIGSTVFASYGSLTSPASVTAGFKPALWACSAFAGLGVLAALAMSGRPKPAAQVESAGLQVAA